MLFNAKYETNGSTKHIANFQLFVWYRSILCSCKAQKILNYGWVFAKKEISCIEPASVQRKSGQISLNKLIFEIISLHTEFPLQTFQLKHQASFGRKETSFKAYANWS